MSQAFFEQLSEEHAGEYHPLATLDGATREKLRDEEILFETPELHVLQAGAGAAPPTSDLAEWDEHRGIYRSASGQFGVLVNEEDHLRVIVRREDGDALAAFASLCRSLPALSLPLEPPTPAPFTASRSAPPPSPSTTSRAPAAPSDLAPARSALGALDRSHAATAGIAASPRRGALTVFPANLEPSMAFHGLPLALH